MASTVTEYKGDDTMHMRFTKHMILWQMWDDTNMVRSFGHAYMSLIIPSCNFEFDRAYMPKMKLLCEVTDGIYLSIFVYELTLYN